MSDDVGGNAIEPPKVAHPHILLEVTRRCNRACVYCYAKGSAAGRELTEVRLQEILERLIPDVMPSGITLIGGEPLLNEELTAIARQIQRHRIAVSLSTNALGLNRARIEELVGAGVTAFELSYDSPDPTTYARLTGSRLGSIQRSLTELVRTGVTVTVGAMLTRSNLGQLEELLQICFVLGVRRVSLNQVALIGNAKDNPSILPTDGELATSLEGVNSLASALGLRVGVGLPIEPCRLSQTRFPALEFERCRCGDCKWLIEPSGNVRVCELASNSVGNIFDESWLSIVKSARAECFRNHQTRTVCQGCKDWDTCRGGCRFRLPQGD